jgi:hypothetical protein
LFCFRSTILAIIFVLISLQVPWDGSTFNREHSAIVICQGFISAITVFQLYRLYDYYVLQVRLDRIKYSLHDKVSVTNR